mgnify:CR=1 FL=1
MTLVANRIPAMSLIQPAGASGLSELEIRVLEFERSWWRYAGAKESAIKELFDLTPARYYQLLNDLIDKDSALAAAPILVKRLRRLREALRPDPRGLRQGQRQLRARGSPHRDRLRHAQPQAPALGVFQDQLLGLLLVREGRHRAHGPAGGHRQRDVRDRLPSPHQLVTGASVLRIEPWRDDRASVARIAGADHPQCPARHRCEALSFEIACFALELKLQLSAVVGGVSWQRHR